jgi:2-haloacid dehalogenase
VAIRAVTLDAYGTLLRNEGLGLIPRRIVADHGLPAGAEEVQQAWLDLYVEAILEPPFRTLRAIQEEVFPRLLRRFGAHADATPYVDLFFRLTLEAEPYPDAFQALAALGDIPAAIVSNADLEHAAAWRVPDGVPIVLVSEAVRAYKPHRAVFQHALDLLGLPPHEVLHVGDSDLEDVQGARQAGLRVAWVNRDGRPLRPGVAAPDFEIRDLAALPGLLTLGPRERP